jgi:hypothetical protein
LISSLAYGDEFFNEIYSAIESGATNIELENLEKRYKNKEVCGEGYVKNVDIYAFEGYAFIHLTVEPRKDVFLDDVVIKVYKNNRCWKIVKKLKKKQKIHFCGRFDDIVGKRIWVKGYVDIYIK